ncbi:hypothetical protein [Streptomyces sp. NPDC048266]|uniref:hypothetical protein n=1 Tax=Streptomyces sp. NPDC048266 TaxID=3155787 RepID=UPI0034089EDB
MVPRYDARAPAPARAGKSTTLRMLLGLDTPTRDRVQAVILAHDTQLVTPA